MYRIVLALSAVSAFGLLVGLGLDLTGLASGESLWGPVLGLSVLGHVLAMTYLGVSAVQVRSEAQEGRRPAWASGQAERNVRRVVPTSAAAVVLVIVAGWLSVAASASKGSPLTGLVSRSVSALAAGVSLAAHGWETLSARTQNRLAMAQDQPGRPRVAGRFSRMEPEPTASGESL
ncbi:MAG TPA: hypothetical protein VFT74_22155 [Isosphaeraceae bacterium]|nr:hypothetical protein [Isosphaeraceae bacterium]